MSLPEVSRKTFIPGTATSSTRKATKNQARSGVGTQLLENVHMMIVCQVEDDWPDLGVMSIGLMVNWENGKTCTANSIRKTRRATTDFYDSASKLVRIKTGTRLRL